MRVAIVGAGGVGGYFGARLAASGQDVSFIARGSHLEAMRAHGLRVASPAGDLHLETVSATADATAIGAVDAVVVAVKAWQLIDVVPLISPLLGKDTAILPLLNGVEAASTLAKEIGEIHVLNGLCRIVAHIESPGLVHHVGAVPFVMLGELDNRLTSRVEKLRDAFDAAGIAVEVPDDIELALWQKFLMIAPASGVTAATRAPYGVMLDMPQVRELLDRAIRETYALGKAHGLAFSENDIENAYTLYRAAPYHGLTSMQRDIQSGRRSELEAQTGAIVRFGERYGVATPVNDTLYRSLLPQEHRARGDVSF